MLRLPNPGSNIDRFIRIYRELFDALKMKTAFSLDDISRTLVERNLATSSGYMGLEALKRSTRKDRSRDPLYNQSKMYAELFRALGWFHPLSSSSLTFKLTLMGAHVVEAINDPTAIFRESVLGITYPNEVLAVKTKSIVRPFSIILKIQERLGGYLSRDEMILGPMNIRNDRNSNTVDEMVDKLSRLRGNFPNLSRMLSQESKSSKISINTMRNYTRFAIAVLTWSGWAVKVRNRAIYSRPIVFLKLTEYGSQQVEWLERVTDVRVSDLKELDKKSRQSFIKLCFYRLLERSGFDLESVDNNINQYEIALSDYLVSKKAKSSEILFSPFQEISSKEIEEIFPHLEIDNEENNRSYAFIEKSGELHDNRLNYEVVFRHVTDGKDVVTDQTKDIIKQEFEEELARVRGHLDEAVKRIKLNHANDKEREFYPLIAKLFRTLGFNCEPTRAGDNYQRWDAIIIDDKHSIPIEVKSPSEEVNISVKAIRQALENKVILLSRKIYPTTLEASTLVVGYNMPNNRSEVSSLISDINKTFNVSIGVIDFESLLKIVGKALFEELYPNKEGIEKLYGFIKISDA
jgi:hypothetical protein